MKAESADPRDVVVDFYADAADLDCAAAVEALYFWGEKAESQRKAFMDGCQDAAGNAWAFDVVVGTPAPETDEADLALFADQVPESTDAVNIPVTEGTATAPSDTLMLKIDGKWFISVR